MCLGIGAMRGGFLQNDGLGQCLSFRLDNIGFRWLEDGYMESNLLTKRIK